ncbi:MAG: flavin reductase family protein [Sphingobium sp.]
MTDQIFSASDYVDTTAFREVLRAVAGSVSIVATGQGDKRRGLTVTTAVSLCLEPPMVLVCVNRNAEAHDVILESGTFSWNVLSVDQIELAKRFAAMDGSKGASRFALMEWGRMSTGCPVLLQSVCSFDCKVQGTLEAGAHTIVTGAVVAQDYNKGKSPLIYSHGKFGKIENYFH